jgi:hypothetical protein
MPQTYYKNLLPLLGNKAAYPDIVLYYTKANISFQNLLALKHANVKTIIPGVETLSTGLLKLLNKGVRAKQNLLLLRNARSVGMNLYWFMLWGVPGDKAEHYQEILDILPLIRHLQPPTKLFCVHLERNSTYVNDPENYGITNLRPWAVYDMIYPDWADKEKLAFWFAGDYACEAYERSDLIQQLADELRAWRETWKNASLSMLPFAGYYAVYDRRASGKGKTHMVEAARASEIMRYGRHTNSGHQEWAVEHELGVVVDGWYVPLVTASAELLMELQELSVSRH